MHGTGEKSLWDFAGENLKERVCLRNLGVNGRIILKRIVK
jgi:hypothetical protein